MGKKLKILSVNWERLNLIYLTAFHLSVYSIFVSCTAKTKLSKFYHYRFKEEKSSKHYFTKLVQKSKLKIKQFSVCCSIYQVIKRKPQTSMFSRF